MLLLNSTIRSTHVLLLFRVMILTTIVMIRWYSWIFSPWQWRWSLISLDGIMLDVAAASFLICFVQEWRLSLCFKDLRELIVIVIMMIMICLCLQMFGNDRIWFQKSLSVMTTGKNMLVACIYNVFWTTEEQDDEDKPEHCCCKWWQCFAVSFSSLWFPLIVCKEWWCSSLFFFFCELLRLWRL